MEVKLSRNPILSLQIENDSDVGVCRRKAVSLASNMGFDDVKSGEVAIMVTELVTNVLKHSGGVGKIVICEVSNERAQKAIEIWCCDSGDGIPDLDNAFKDGYTKSGTLGLGLGTIKRLSDEMEINPKIAYDFKDSFLGSKQVFKNCIRTIKWKPSKIWINKNKSLTIGAASRPKPGEQLNGDSYVVKHNSAECSVVSVIDGLGHGKDANWASASAREQILLKSDLPIDNLIKQTHLALRGTRGATIGISSINTRLNKLLFTGIGNIEGFIVNGESSKKSLISLGGIIGHNMRSPKVFDFQFFEGNTLCMFSDGITSRWSPSDIDWKQNPQKIAEQILNTYSRANDDATVLIVSHTG